MTGGRAILHDREVTYSVVTPHGGMGIIESYRSISEGLRLSLERLGVRSDMGRASAKEGRNYASCFAAAARSDLVLRPILASDAPIPPVKLAGSAQCRRGDALLQQGTIPISWNCEAFAALFGRRPEEEGASCLADALGRLPSESEVAKAILEGFRELWGREAISSGFSNEEFDRAERLRAERYATREWTLRGSRLDS
jgi:lipoate-protein ligase A